MSSIQKIRTYVYDTPATYDQFYGGINTNLSNETLQANELRDGLNCHYEDTTLTNRKGEKIIGKLKGMQDKRFQGDFLFTTDYSVKDGGNNRSGNTTYIISVRNGLLYYGIYNDGDVTMTYLPIKVVRPTKSSGTYDRSSPKNYAVDLVVKKDYDETTHTDIPFTSYTSIPTYNSTVDPSDDDEGYLFEYKTSTMSSSELHLVLQNFKPIQGIQIRQNLNPNDDPDVPYPDEEENFFLLATGTRLIRIKEVTTISSDQQLLVIRSLEASILECYVPNSWEYQNIGVNNLSPFPNYLIHSVEGTPKSLIGQILTTPQEVSTTYLATSTNNVVAEVIVGTEINYSPSDFYYKWEARFGDTSQWVTVWSWNNVYNPLVSDSETVHQTSKNKMSIELSPSLLQTIRLFNKGSGTIAANDKLYIRCTMTDEFEYTYDIASETETLTTSEDECGYDYTTNSIKTYETDSYADYVADQSVAQYSKTFITKTIVTTFNPDLTLQECYNSGWKTPETRAAHGFYEVDTQFLKMHSCTKITSDGSKIILYDDNERQYNSGEWYKSVVGLDNYISYNGNLNFKTTKNEQIVGVVIFDSAIVVFSDNQKLGGNISIVTGNGDDYNEGDYYSPYKRKIVNTHISCDCFNSIQVCENLIFFKYRDDIYTLDTNDLSNDKIEVVSILDKVKTKLNNIEFPLNKIKPYNIPMYDFYNYYNYLQVTDVFSHVEDGYYGLVFPHQGHFLDLFDQPDTPYVNYVGATESILKELKERYNNSDRLLIENNPIKPGLRWKCYFRNGQQYNNSSKVSYPWLRDVSNYLNIINVIKLNGITTFILKDGSMVQFNNTKYNELEDYKVRIATKCYDMDLPTLCKFLDNLNVYYNRDFTKTLYYDMWVKNEAGFEIYGPNDQAYITLDEAFDGVVKFGERYRMDDALNYGDSDLSVYDSSKYIDPSDRPVMILEETKWSDLPTLTRPSYTSQTLTPRHRFPFLSAQFIMELHSNQAFSLSSLTFSFTSNDMPDFTREKLYRDIIRR